MVAFKVKRDRDNGFKSFFKSIATLDGKRAKVGIQGSEAAAVIEGTLTAAHLGAIHEFGVPAPVDPDDPKSPLMEASGGVTIPQRSFLRSTADINHGKYKRTLARGIRKMVKSPETFEVKTILFSLGERVRADIINRIRRGEIKQDLAESTKKAKARKAGGVVEPALIDTGLLIQSITAVVK